MKESISTTDHLFLSERQIVTIQTKSGEIITGEVMSKDFTGNPSVVRLFNTFYMRDLGGEWDSCFSGLFYNSNRFI